MADTLLPRGHATWHGGQPMSHPHSNIQAAARSLCERTRKKVRSLFLSDAMHAMLLLVACIVFLAGCTLHVPVDKRVTVLNFIHAQSTIGAVNVDIPTTTTNTSDTKADAEQAIRGKLSIPLLP